MDHHRHHDAYDGPATWLGGTLPQWLTAVATVVAFGWAVFIYTRSVADKRKEQPRLVYAIPMHGGAKIVLMGDNTRGNVEVVGLTKRMQDASGSTMMIAQVDLCTMWIKVVNDSTETISEVSVAVVSQEGLAFEHGHMHVADFMAPGASETVQAVFELPEGHTGQWLVPIVFFTDGVGLLWNHRAGAALFKVSKDRTIWEILGQAARGAYYRLRELPRFLGRG